MSERGLGMSKRTGEPVATISKWKRLWFAKSDGLSLLLGSKISFVKSRIPFSCVPPLHMHGHVP